MATMSTMAFGGSRFWILVFSLAAFLGSVNSLVIGERDTMIYTPFEELEYPEYETFADDYYPDSSVDETGEGLNYTAANQGFETRARALAQRVPALYPECNDTSSTAYNIETRLQRTFEELESAVAGSEELLLPAYNALLDLILANWNSSKGICNGDYVELAYKVLQLGQNNAAGNSSVLNSKAEEKLQKLKQRFHPGVFKLLNETTRFVMTAPGNRSNGYALYATEKPVFKYNGTDVTFPVMRRFGTHRLPAFHWNLVSADKSKKRGNQFNLLSTTLNGTKLQLPFRQGPLQLIPTSESLLDTNSELFQFRITQSTEDLKEESLMFYSLGWNDKGVWLRKSVLPQHLQTNDVVMLHNVRNRLKDASVFALLDIDEVKSEKISASNISEQVRELYPKCNNEKDLLDAYRLSDFLQVFNIKSESARLRAAYEALLEEITASEFLCGQDYVQLAYHVLQRCGDGNATGDEEEQQQAWRDFKGRFNPRVLELFDVEKSWAMVSTDKPGYAYDWASGKGLIRWDSRLFSLSLDFVFEDKARRFEPSAVINQMRNQESPENTKKKVYFAPTRDSILPAAATFKFWLITGDDNYFEVIGKQRIFRAERDFKESEECQGLQGNNLNCSALFYFEDMTEFTGPSPVTSVEDAQSWYPPCEDARYLYDEWRMPYFFIAFNARTMSSSELVQAYSAMFEAITTSSPLICSQDYVQLAFHVQQIQQSLNSSAEDQENWALLRSRFNPKVFDLFDETKTWKIVPVGAEYTGYAIFGSDRHGQYELMRSTLELLKVDSRFPAFNWRFRFVDEGRAFELKSDSGSELSFEASFRKPVNEEPFRQQFVPSVGSLAANSTVFEFNIVVLNEALLWNVEPTSNYPASRFEPEPPLLRLGFLEKNQTFHVSYSWNFNGSALFRLETPAPAAPSADVSIADQVKELFPLCETPLDALTLDRLWDVFQVFNLDLVNSSLLIEAYEATLEAILSPSPFNCTADYVQLASQVYQLENKLNQTNVDKNQLSEFARLKNRFNPGVFKLFDDRKMYRIMSINQPGYAVYAREFPSRYESSDPFRNNLLGLRRLAANNGTSATSGPLKWKFQQALRARSLQLNNGDDSKPWKSVLVIPTVESLDSSVSSAFEFELQYLNYDGYTLEREVLTIERSNSSSVVPNMAPEEEHVLELVAYSLDSVVMGDIAKFKLQDF